MDFFTLRYPSYQGKGILGLRNAQLHTRWPRTGTRTPFERASAIYEHPSGQHLYATRRAPAPLSVPRASPRRRSRRQRAASLALRSRPVAALCGAGAQLHHHAIEQAKRATAGSRQPRLSSSRSAGSQARAAALPTCRRFGAARRACQCEEPAVRCFFGRTKSGSSFLKNNVEK